MKPKKASGPLFHLVIPPKNMVLEASKSQLKVFLRLVWPTPDSISIVGWPGGHMNLWNTLEMCFEGYNWVEQGSRIHFGLDFNGFWGIQDPDGGIFRVGMAYTW